MVTQERFCTAEALTSLFWGVLKTVWLVAGTMCGPWWHISSEHKPLPEPLISSPVDRLEACSLQLLRLLEVCSSVRMFCKLWRQQDSLVSWKSTSRPLRAFFSLCVMILSCIICWRIIRSGLVMSISTSGLLIWLARPSPITSGRYLIQQVMVLKTYRESRSIINQNTVV